MKTTIDIADSLLEKAKRIARQQERTLRDIIEDALRRQLTETKPTRPFKLKRHVFKGEGLQPGVAEGGWSAIRDLIHRLG